jgi:hypothetical protein
MSLPTHPKFPDKKESDGTDAHKPENSEGSSPMTSSKDTRQTRPALIPFITELLSQGVLFADSIVPQTFKSGKQKSAPPAKARVQLLKRDISASELRQISWAEGAVTRKAPALNSSEVWFARRSRHQDKTEDGTATFEEFATGLRDDHSEHEREYTPNVYDSFKVLDWDEETAAEGFTIEGYSMVTMSSTSLVLFVL